MMIIMMMMKMMMITTIFVNNIADCYTKKEAEECESWNGTWYNQTCYNDTSEVPEFRRTSAAEEYFK